MTTNASGNNDALLVECTLAGDRAAFAMIVKRYQSLVCSITYNATGSLSLSEDLAQETFLAAWKQLSDLREPARLRSWLCGITRFLVGKEFRRQGREPIHAAESLEEIQEPTSLEASSLTQAVSREEEVILWRALERIPDTYREPLILYYREEKSIERVAVELELSEDAVKQRLSRGRKLLHEEVVAFVEGTLSRTAPGQSFSKAVLAMLPVVPAASVGAGVAGKGAAMAKSGSITTWLAPLTPFVGVFAGLMANWISVRSAPTARERRFRGSWLSCFWTFVLGWAVAGQYAVRALRHGYAWSDQTYFAVVAGFWWIYAMMVAGFIVLFLRRGAAMRRWIEQEPGIPESSGAPMTLASAVAMVAGIYVAMFSALIYLAFKAHDMLAGAILLGAMIVLGGWNLFYVGSRDGMAGRKVAARPFVLGWAVILVVLNLRLGGWLAAYRGVDLAVIHRLLPAWAIPMATLTLPVWIGALVALTRPRRADVQDGLGRNDRGNSVKALLFLIFLAHCFLALAPSALGQSQMQETDKPVLPGAAIPEDFLPLYRNLDETLRQTGKAYPYKRGGPRPQVAPNLMMASSMYPPAAPDSQRWKDLIATLDAFKAMGMDTVYIQILAPDLTFGDTHLLVGFYQRLAKEIHARKMKLYVEHFVDSVFTPNFPSAYYAANGPNAFKGVQDDPQGRQEFLKIMADEAELIYREIKPDYLTLIDEPQDGIMKVLHLSYTCDELTQWVGEVTTHLKSTGASPHTLLGAGALTWEPEEYALNLARQKNLDYVDFHVFLFKMKGEDQVARLASLMEKIRAERPKMRVTIGETWLLKAGAGAPRPKTPQELFSRSNYSFWSPLDVQFLTDLMGIAQKENISVIAPSASQYFFIYYTFGDAEFDKLPQGIGSCFSANWDKAIESIRSHRLSSTGKAMSAMLNDNGN